MLNGHLFFSFRAYKGRLFIADSVRQDFRQSSLQINPNSATHLFFPPLSFSFPFFFFFSIRNSRMKLQIKSMAEQIFGLLPALAETHQTRGHECSSVE